MNYAFISYMNGADVRERADVSNVVVNRAIVLKDNSMYLTDIQLPISISK